MSKGNIKKFIEECKENLVLQQKLRTLKPSDEAEFNKIVNEAGFDFSVEEWREYMSEISAVREGKLSDNELASVSAGGLFGDCPQKYDDWLCISSFCPNVKERRISCKASYRFCQKGFWDEEKGTGAQPAKPNKTITDINNFFDWVWG